jgi:uncharacterized protein involved in cysteine biosynthesis
MKSLYQRAKKMIEDKKGVFGLNSVQQFFAAILGIALLGYVIVIIMGTLSGAGIVSGTALAQSNNILGNVSNGVTSFFTSINPVYAILAVLVIILILVVLVRVVSGGTSGGNPQL